MIDYVYKLIDSCPNFALVQFITFCVKNYCILGYCYILRQKLLTFGLLSRFTSFMTFCGRKILPGKEKEIGKVHRQLKNFLLQTPLLVRISVHFPDFPIGIAHRQQKVSHSAFLLSETHPPNPNPRFYKHLCR